MFLTYAFGQSNFKTVIIEATCNISYPVSSWKLLMGPPGYIAKKTDV